MPRPGDRGVPATGDASSNHAHVHTMPIRPNEDAPRGSVALDIVTARGATTQAFLTPAEATALAHDLLGAVLDLAPALSFPVIGSCSRCPHKWHGARERCGEPRDQPGRGCECNG